MATGKTSSAGKCSSATKLNKELVSSTDSRRRAALIERSRKEAYSHEAASHASRGFPWRVNGIKPMPVSGPKGEENGERTAGH